MTKFVGENWEREQDIDHEKCKQTADEFCKQKSAGFFLYESSSILYKKTIHSGTFLDSAMKIWLRKKHKIR